MILGGLRLLFALLPRCERRWEAEILADEDCGLALAALGANGHVRHLESTAVEVLRKSEDMVWYSGVFRLRIC